MQRVHHQLSRFLSVIVIPTAPPRPGLAGHLATWSPESLWLGQSLLACRPAATRALPSAISAALPTRRDAAIRVSLALRGSYRGCGSAVTVRVTGIRPWPWRCLAAACYTRLINVPAPSNAQQRRAEPGGAGPEGAIPDRDAQRPGAAFACVRVALA